MKKPRVVPNWKEAYRWHSTQVLTFIAAAPLIWMELPIEAQELIRSLVPEEHHPLIITVIALVGIMLRLRDQSKPQPVARADKDE